MRKGSSMGNALFYLDKAVDASDDDETALIARARCYFILGNYDQATLDSRLALLINPVSVAARQTLGEALYSSGQFESALLQFYRSAR